MLKKILFLILVSIISQTLYSKDFLEHFKLKNGLEVLLVPDNKTELVMHSVFYKVGGLQDFYGKAGLAHFLEHLMFNSTKNHKRGELVDFFDKNGTIYNAATGNELTFYYELGGKNLLEDFIRFESDRMKNLLLNDEEINREREIIKEERRMRVDNIPEEKFLEKLLNIFYNNDYYGVSLIGSMNDLHSILNQDFRNFYYKYYNPSNAILVIAGNFDLKKTKILIDKYYGILKNDEVDLSNYYKNLNPELPSKTKNLFFEERDKNIKQSNYYYLTTAPTFSSKNKKEGFAAELLSYVIENGDNMLKKKLVEDMKIASNVSIQYNSFGSDNSPFLIKITPVDNSKIHEIKDFMNDFFKNQKTIISEEELKRLKNLYIGQNIYMMDSLHNKAMMYGQIMLSGMDPKLMNDFKNYIENVTISDIEEIYKKVFVENSYIVGILSGKLS
jgi:zinc protease